MYGSTQSSTSGLSGSVSDLGVTGDARSLTVPGPRISGDWGVLRIDKNASGSKIIGRLPNVPWF